MRIRDLIQIVEHFGENRTYYHVTLTDNLPEIMEKGLMPSSGDRSRQLDEPEAVFLFPSRDSAEDAVSGWLGDETDEDQPLALLEVMVPAEIEIHRSPDLDWEVYTRDAIPARCLKILSRDF